MEPEYAVRGQEQKTAAQLRVETANQRAKELLRESKVAHHRAPSYYTGLVQPLQAPAGGGGGGGPVLVDLDGRQRLVEAGEYLAELGMRTELEAGAAEGTAAGDEDRAEAQAAVGAWSAAESAEWVGTLCCGDGAQEVRHATHRSPMRGPYLPYVRRCTRSGSRSARGVARLLSV
jgi:hypothetical protein